MKRIVNWIQELRLILLDIDPAVKRTMVIEMIVGIFMGVLGILWGGYWILLGLVVAGYVVADLFMAVWDGVVDAVRICGTVSEVKRTVSGRTITIDCGDGERKTIQIPFDTVRKKIKVGDSVDFIVYPKVDIDQSEKGACRILEYHVYSSGKKEKQKREVSDCNTNEGA